MLWQLCVNTPITLSLFQRPQHLLKNEKEIVSCSDTAIKPDEA